MSNTGVEQVFLYEALSGKLTCVSCDPTGEAPVPTNASTNTTDSVGAALPVSLQQTYQPRWITEDGSRVFFESAQPLVPQATNGWLDVYEWERDGPVVANRHRVASFCSRAAATPKTRIYWMRRRTVTTCSSSLVRNWWRRIVTISTMCMTCVLVVCVLVSRLRVLVAVVRVCRRRRRSSRRPRASRSKGSATSHHHCPRNIRGASRRGRRSARRVS